MTNTQITAYAEELAGKLTSIASLQSEAKDLINSAKDAGINTRALRKVARELVMDSDKRAKLYNDEDQLEMFRADVGLRTKDPMTITKASLAALKEIRELREAAE